MRMVYVNLLFYQGILWCRYIQTDGNINQDQLLNRGSTLEKVQNTDVYQHYLYKL